MCCQAEVHYTAGFAGSCSAFPTPFEFMHVQCKTCIVCFFNSSFSFKAFKSQININKQLNFFNFVYFGVFLFPLSNPRSPNQPFQAVVPTLSAVFVDENLPDGTHLKPGTKFIKHWRMKNTGNVEWSSDTKVSYLCSSFCMLKSFRKITFVCEFSGRTVLRFPLACWFHSWKFWGNKLCRYSLQV